MNAYAQIRRQVEADGLVSLKMKGTGEVRRFWPIDAIDHVKSGEGEFAFAPQQRKSPLQPNVPLEVMVAPDGSEVRPAKPGKRPPSMSAPGKPMPPPPLPGAPLKSGDGDGEEVI